MAKIIKIEDTGGNIFDVTLDQNINSGDRWLGTHNGDYLGKGETLALVDRANHRKISLYASDELDAYNRITKLLKEQGYG